MTRAIVVTQQAQSTLSRIFSEIDACPDLRSRHTRDSYKSDLRQFEVWRNGRAMSKLLVESYLVELQNQHKSPASMNRTLAAIRWWCRRMVELAYSEHWPDDQRDEAERIVSRMTGIKRQRPTGKKRGRLVPPEEMGKLLRVCRDDPRPQGARDLALLAIAWTTGLRREELVNLSFSSFVRTGSNSGMLRVVGKGEKYREATVDNGTYDALISWLAIRGSNDGPMWTCFDKFGRPNTDFDSVSSQSLMTMLQRRCKEAGIPHGEWHNFRRSFATELIKRSGDILLVAKLMGHANPNTTKIYDYRADEEAAKLARTMTLPG